MLLCNPCICPGLKVLASMWRSCVWTSLIRLSRATSGSSSIIISPRLPGLAQRALSAWVARIPITCMPWLLRVSVSVLPPQQPHRGKTETPTVTDLQRFGMQLHWLGYAGYRARHDADFWLPWQAQYPDLHPIPEGGGGVEGALGCADLLWQVQRQLKGLGWDDYDAWWLAAGTGTTLAGLVLAEAGAHLVYGALAVPEDHGVAQNVAAIVGASRSGLVREEGFTAYHLLDASRGGFAKTDAHLLAFIAASQTQSGVPLEPLYTGKALLALHDQIRSGLFPRGTRFIFVHTGGLQGWRSQNL